MPVSFCIRAATEADVPAIHGLIVELAVFEREPDAVTLSEAQLRADGWGARPAFDCLLAEGADGAVRGFALYHPIYSTWEGRSLYLEDLYVQQEFRRQGIGRALLARVAAEGVAQGCARLDWSVLTWNEPALAAYTALGALRMEEWRRMRLSGSALGRLAASAALSLGGEKQVLRSAQDDAASVGAGANGDAHHALHGNTNNDALHNTRHAPTPRHPERSEGPASPLPERSDEGPASPRQEFPR